MDKRRTWFLLLFLMVPALIYAQEANRDLLLDDLKYLASDALEGRKPLTTGSLKTREFIKQRFDSLGLTSQYKDYTQFFTLKNGNENEPASQAANIIGFIPGQESAKVIVITAHYDHLGNKGEKIYHGADDNASGTAGLLALAAYFSENKPNFSLMFAALDAEEMGLQGARALVRNFPFPLENILLNINMDMISRSDKNELFAAGTRHYPQLQPVLEACSKGAGINLRFGHDEPGTGANDWTNASDHAAFHEKRIPFVYFGVEDHEDYHQTTDTYENVDHDFYYRTVNLIIKCTKALDEFYLMD